MNDPMTGLPWCTQQNDSSFTMYGPMPGLTGYTQTEQNNSRLIGAFDGKLLYRCLREDEDWNVGLAPKDPDATYSVNQHVRGYPMKQKQMRYETQYISTTASLIAARAWAALSPDPSSIQIVKIDLEKMKTADIIINLTDPIARILLLAGEPMRNDAKEFEEVLLTGHITSDCLTLTNPWDDDNVDQITEGIVITPIETFDGKLLYRCLREDEDWNVGLAPKDPDATYSVNQHVRGRPKKQRQYETQYISTTASLRAARAWAALSPDPSSIQIVKIDVEKMKKTNEEIINLTDPNVRTLLLAGEPIRNYEKNSRKFSLQDTSHQIG